VLEGKDPLVLAILKLLGYSHPVPRFAEGGKIPVKDIGLQRSPIGDVPGVLDALGTGEGLLADILQAALKAGTEARFGMTPEEKFARTVSPKGAIPGFVDRAPKSAETDIAQRALSVAAGTQRFGPIIPTSLSLLAVDNPALANPETARATLDALEATQKGAFVPGPLVGGRPLGETVVDKALKAITKPLFPEASFAVSKGLLNLLGAKNTQESGKIPQYQYGGPVQQQNITWGDSPSFGGMPDAPPPGWGQGPQHISGYGVTAPVPGFEQEFQPGAPSPMPMQPLMPPQSPEFMQSSRASFMQPSVGQMRKTAARLAQGGKTPTLAELIQRLLQRDSKFLKQRSSPSVVRG